MIFSTLAVVVLAADLNSDPELIVNEVASNVEPLMVTQRFVPFPLTIILPKLALVDATPKPAVCCDAGAVIVYATALVAVLTPSPKRKMLFDHVDVAVLLKLNAFPANGGSTIVIVPPVTFCVPESEANTVPLATLPVAVLSFPSIVIVPLTMLKVPDEIMFPFSVNAPALIAKVPALFTVALPPPTGPTCNEPPFSVKVAPALFEMPMLAVLPLLIVKLAPPKVIVPELTIWPVNVSALLFAIKVPPAFTVMLFALLVPLLWSRFVKLHSRLQIALIETLDDEEHAP